MAATDEADNSNTNPSAQLIKRQQQLSLGTTLTVHMYNHKAAHPGRLTPTTTRRFLIMPSPLISQAGPGIHFRSCILDTGPHSPDMGLSQTVTLQVIANFALHKRSWQLHACGCEDSSQQVGNSALRMRSCRSCKGSSQSCPWAVMLQQELMDKREHLCLHTLAHQDVKVACNMQQQAAHTSQIQQMCTASSGGSSSATKQVTTQTLRVATAH